ncbi:MAG: protein translocase SEC61 complex subunit gamma [Candidatus Thermoplasmatota archaeon]
MATAASPAPQQTERDTLIGKAWDAQDKLEGRLSYIGKGKYGRVLRMARKPTPDEYRKASIVSAAGLVILGAIGFLVFYLMSFIPQ